MNHDTTTGRAGEGVFAELATLRDALPDPGKLIALADWLDLQYPEEHGTGAVQADLRLWAYRAAQALGVTTIQRPPVETTDERIAALRARLEAAEQERDEWARVAVGADHDRAGEYGERVEAEERLAAAEARSVRLAEALRDVGGQDVTGDRICWCDGGPEHAPECDDARAALAEYDAAVKGGGDGRDRTAPRHRGGSPGTGGSG